MLSIFFRLLLRPAPTIRFDDSGEIENYEKVISALDNSGNELLYELPYSKTRFLTYLATTGKYLFHGSNDHLIRELGPRKQTLYNNKLTKAVFASTDPVWSCFYAVFDRSKLVGGFRNGCIVIKSKKYHYYSINHETYNKKPWVEGMIYILPGESFEKSGHDKVQFDEWISYDPVKPLFKPRITVDDFHFKNKVSRHRIKESMAKTLLLYKLRTS